MNEILKIKKARGFGGNIWEPFFARRTKEKSTKLIVCGCELPASKGSNVNELLNKNLSDITHFDFSNLQELKTYINKIKEEGHFMGKALHDNNAAIDGVLIVVKSSESIR
eukprot:scaffold487016_cov71-Attheya_sp.AAC.1